ncbi:TPA: GNAT family N-acetyltransferase [Listeria innocua]|uniref:GNAT family N-acetyltransferase n=1 Tax=Listeria innocua TaxID=1642 RepID=UPI0012EF6C56|nr:GNAT family N-acetyltransferase [Listeria innocua]EKY4027457.1 GNAT family N-acetyltransferase [Listeria innocua]ELD8333064.1 GNAT family N-acetyltransferase [Listeria innocua]ELY0464156.1 GNAT family N-acetyltransferase [Listeria innocua]ELY0467036.1 GNAT family N-acetyltransferase [Listeria innocua]ELY0469988.1 GNAT family N-acetyltransferase [Listeria innocua]
MNQNKVTAGGLEFLVRFALPNDRSAINELMVNTARWLKESGSTQWSDILHGFDVHNIEQRIELSEVALFEATDGKLAGVMIIRKTPSDWDTDLWGDRHEQSAYYLHRIMVSRDFSGISLSKQMISFAEQLALNMSVPFVRLDCIKTNEALNKMYLRYGFIFSGEKNGFNLYQKELSLL